MRDRFFSHSIDHLRTGVFFAAVVAYAVFSSSTPDSLGFPEALIACSLIFMTGITGLFGVMGGHLLWNRVSVAPPFVYLSALGLICIPFIWGQMGQQNTIKDCLRDIIPLLYFLSPLFLLPTLRNLPDKWQQRLALGLCGIGVAFSARFMFIDIRAFRQELGHGVIPGDLNYYQMDPATLFAATFLLLTAISHLSRMRWVTGCFLLLLSLMPIMAMIASAVRGQLALLILALIIYALVGTTGLFRRISTWSIVVLLAILFHEQISQTAQLLWFKHQQVGFHARAAEISAVLHFAESSPLSFLLGKGWGGTIITSVVAGIPVRFVHNSGAYFLFKGGLIGTLFAFLYAMWCASCLFQASKTALIDEKRLILLLSCVAPIILHSTVETGYKMLSFGFILCIVTLFPSVPITRGVRE